MGMMGHSAARHPHENVMRSSKFMGEEVILALKDVTPPDEIYEDLAVADPSIAKESVNHVAL
jgi:hypothetical protein